MDTGKKRVKGPEIGLHQARGLCQLDESKRLAFIAEGLPVILWSAQGFWTAAEQLQTHPREAKVLEGWFGLSGCSGEFAAAERAVGRIKPSEG